jgi:hypothetical protein
LILLFIPREVTPWMALLLITFVPSLIQGQIPEPSRDFLDSINC